MVKVDVVNVSLEEGTALGVTKEGGGFWGTDKAGWVRFHADDSQLRRWLQDLTRGKTVQTKVTDDQLIAGGRGEPRTESDLRHELVATERQQTRTKEFDGTLATTERITRWRCLHCGREFRDGDKKMGQPCSAAPSG